MAKARPTNRKVGAEGYAAALADVAALVEALGHPAAIIGGVAVIAHGFARATADIDVAVSAEQADIPQLVRLARTYGFRPRIPNAAKFAAENLVLLLVHAGSGVPLDLSLALQGFERSANESSVGRSIGGVAVRVTPLWALLIYKMVASRPKDLDDVRALVATGAPFDGALIVRTLRELDAVLETSRVEEFEQLLRH